MATPIIKVISVVSMICFAVCSESAHARAEGEITLADKQAAQTMIHELSQNVYAVLRDTNISRKTRDDRLRELIYGHFDFDVITKVVLGINRRTSTKNQLKRFRAVFPEYIMQIYVNRLDDYKNSKVDIKKAYRTGRRPELIVMTAIETQIYPEPVKADWRVRKVNGDWRIVDLAIENVSMASNMREEFNIYIRERGMEALISNVTRAAKLSSKQQSTHSRQPSR